MTRVDALWERYLNAIKTLEEYAASVTSPADEEIIKQEYRKVRLYYGEQDTEIFGRIYFMEYFENVTPDFHLEIDAQIDEYERKRDDYRGVVLAAPRGHGKTVRVCLIKVMYWIVFKKKKFVILISDSGTQADSLTMDLKLHFEQNERLREDFGSLCGDAYGLRWSTGDFYVAFPHENPGDDLKHPKVGHTCRVVSRGTGAGMRGLKSRASRPDAIVLDDFENDELVLTPAQRLKTWNWLMGAVVPMLHPSLGSLVINGTVLHYDSALSKLLAQNDIYLTKRYQAIKDDGTALWPDRFPMRKLLQLKRQMGPLKFGQEYQNDPIDDETQIFKPGYLNWYTSSQISYDEQKQTWMFRGEVMRIWQGIDPAIAEKEQADDFVCFTVGVTPTNKIILLEAWAAHIGFIDQVLAVVSKYQEWIPAQVAIEVNAYQKALKQQVIKDAMIPVRALEHMTDKFTRIETMVPFFANGQVYMRAAMDDEPGFIDQSRLPNVRIHEKFKKCYEQMVTFTAHAAHDDILDALEDCLEIAKPKVNMNEFYKPFYETEQGLG